MNRGIAITLVRVATCVLALLCVRAPVAWAAEPETGVSPTRVSLPDGPGSLEGIGENVEPNINMGLMSYPVNIEVPQGYAGMAPSLSLNYSSGSGQSVVGIGWSFSTPSIERMTSRGLPDYHEGDRMAANGGTELVHVGEGVYRERYEGSFVRYTWLGRESSDGAEGYWRAEYPDGRLGYFGADARGVTDNNAIVRGPEGIFRWHLVEMVDAYDHRTRYEYTKDGSTSLLRRVLWVFDARGRARYEAELFYEDRRNGAGQLVDVVSNAQAGFDIRLTKRLDRVDVRTRGALLRRYDLVHQDYSASGDITRLGSVVRYGMDGAEPYPIVFSFQYSDERLPSRPIVYDMGATGVSFGSPGSDLIDLNGDALPDVVDTRFGQHTVFFNELLLADDDEQRIVGSRFAPQQIVYAGALSLANTGTTSFDLDGNGLTDLVDTENEVVLFNDGTGDWRASRLPASIAFPETTDPDRRFVDIDGDGRIDSFRSDGDSNLVSLNRYQPVEPGAPGLGTGGFVEDAFPEGFLPLGFARDGLQLADMNGDGSPDAVLRAPDAVSYRLNLGRGRWSGIIEMAGLAGSWDGNASFVDINGDGFSDLVNVIGNEVRYALNRTGRRFDPVEAIRTSDLASGFIPERTADMQVRFADMNGSGTTDVVWIDLSGRVRYLELFPVRPNLLSRIENGIGRIIEITYGSSAHHLARDGGNWEYRVPNPMLTVDRIRQWDTLSMIPQIRDFFYHEGAYDGYERQFRGFRNVTEISWGDESMETGKIEHEFDLGIGDGRYDPYFHGKTLRTANYSNDRLLNEVEWVWQDCEVADVDGAPLDTPVRSICNTRMDTIHREEQAPGVPSGLPVRVREQYEYDAWGNRTLTAKLGVVNIGSGGCAPCDRPADLFGEPCNRGAAVCVGDELYERTTFVPPTATGGRYMLRSPCRTERYGDPTSSFRTDERTYYDGEAFVGLPWCTLERGAVTRTTAKVNADSDEVIQTARHRNNEHGQPIELLDGEGYKRRFEYDAEGILVTGEVVVFDAAWRAEPYELRMDVEYHRVLEKVVRSANWNRIVAGTNVSTQRVTEYAYDAFGRLIAQAEPGDSLDRPTQEFRYELADPVSRIVTLGRSVSGAPIDLETVDCQDGLGRSTQTRTRISPGRYQVAGFTRFNSQGKEYEVFQPYVSTTGACDAAPPRDQLSVTGAFDATGRIRTMTMPDAAIYGTASVERTVYRPLATDAWDAEDTDPTSPFRETPQTEVVDGLGRVVSTARLDARGGSPIVMRYRYDGLGALSGWIDEAGNTKVQLRNLLGWVDEVNDPDSGITQFEYNNLGKVVSRTDGDGRTVITRYDEAGRMRETFEAGAEASTKRRLYLDHATGCPSTAPCANAEGALAVAEYPGVATTNRDYMSYDVRGRAVQMLRQIEGEGLLFVTGYDNAGRVTSERFPGGEQIARTHDGLDRLIAYGGLVEVSYDERGDLRGIATSNAMLTEYEYDAARRVRRTRVDAAGVPLVDVALTRLRTRHPTRETDALLRPHGHRRDAVYELDALYRLRAATFGSGPGAERLTYTFDRLDNLTAVRSTDVASPGHIGSYVFGNTGPHAPHRLTRTSGPAVDFVYDDAGRITSFDGRALEWSAYGELTGVVNGALRAHYSYDVAQQRVYGEEGATRRWSPAPSVEVANGMVSVRLDVGGARRVTVDRAYRRCADLACTSLVPPSSSTLPATLTAQRAGVGTTQLRQQLAAAAGRVWIGERRHVSSLDVDALGQTRVVVGPTGAVESESASYPYGAVRWTTGKQQRTPALFGHELDATGFIDAGARSTAPSLARWLSPDPLYEVLNEVPGAEGVNRWLMVNGNPVSWVDPTGMSAEAAQSSERSERFQALGLGDRLLLLGAMALDKYAGTSLTPIGQRTTSTGSGGSGGATNSASDRQQSSEVSAPRTVDEDLGELGDIANTAHEGYLERARGNVGSALGKIREAGSGVREFIETKTAEAWTKVDEAADAAFGGGQ